MKFTIEWLDGRRKAQCQPNPAFPTGIDVDVSDGRTPVCKVSLPYPAKRCGSYVVTCDICKINVMITTAGRIDDPRSVTIACNREMQ
jgi:hypothetical protein